MYKFTNKSKSTDCFTGQISKNQNTSIPSAQSHLLSYQLVNVIDPSYNKFIRNFIIDNYYLTIYGTKSNKLEYFVRYEKKYVDGRTVVYTEILDINRINALFDKLENLHHLTETKMEIIDNVRETKTNQEIKQKKGHYNKEFKEIAIKSASEKRLD